MANAASLIGTRPARIMLVGYPGTAKTGSLASLIDAGFKMRVLDYDGNFEPLLEYVNDKSKLANVDIVSLEDKTRAGRQSIEPVGVPTAFSTGVDLMDRWKYKDADGNDVDLGQSKDWGDDTIVVLDSLTSMGLAAFRRSMVMQNKTPMNTTDRVWGLAMAEQEAFIERLTSVSNNHHVIVLAHLKMVGPADVRKGDSDLTQQLKRDAAALVDTRLFPSALGKALPPVIGGHFPTLLLAETRSTAGQMRRVLVTQPRPELDVKIPADIPKELDAATGMLKVFEALCPQAVAKVKNAPLLQEEGKP